MIYDPAKEFTITNEKMHSDCDYTIWEGVTVHGYPVQTYSRGKLVFDDGITEINGLSTSEKIMNSQGRDFYIVIPTNSSAYNVSIVVDANTEVTSSKLLSPSANIAYKADPIVQVRKESIR